MKTIYKYNFDIQDEWHITTFKGATPLRIGLDSTDSPAIWFSVDTLAITETRKLRIIGTGHPLSDNSGEYVGSFLQGSFVWHAFLK